jgi:hypothetical protein
MKAVIRFAVLAIFVMLTSCKKDIVTTREVDFTSTQYEFLGTYDSTGKPDYLVAPDTISAGLLSFISTNLPDGKNLTLSRPDLFASSASADIVVTKPTNIYVTFVSADAGFTNSVAFYSYPTGQSPTSAADIKYITYIFPNAGAQTPLVAGDKVKIGSFTVGTTVGFALMEDAWNLTTHTLDNDVVHFCSDDALNPEVSPSLKRHAVLLNYTPENKVLVSFEDTNRTDPSCDNDFNDVVIYCTLTDD